MTFDTIALSDLVSIISYLVFTLTIRGTNLETFEIVFDGPYKILQRFFVGPSSHPCRAKRVRGLLLDRVGALAELSIRGRKLW